MPRQERIDLSGCLYHIISRGINEKRIFDAFVDYEEFLKRLERSLKDTGCECYAWALMKTHFHLLIKSGDNGISQFMRKLLTGYANYFNKENNRQGRLFQNRFKAIICQEDLYLKELIRYIHLNPVRSYKVESMEELDLYPYTGHSAIMGNKIHKWMNFNGVFKLFGDSDEQSKNNYHSFVKDKFFMRSKNKFSGGGLLRSAGGWEKVKQLRNDNEFWYRDERILGDSDFVKEILDRVKDKKRNNNKYIQKGLDMEKLIKKTCRIFDVEQETLLKRGRDDDASEAKSVMIFFAKKYLKLTGSDLARYLNISRQAVSWNYFKGEQIVLERSIELF